MRMNTVLARKIERLKGEVLYLEGNRARFLKTGLNDMKRFISLMEGL